VKNNVLRFCVVVFLNCYFCSSYSEENALNVETNRLTLEQKKGQIKEKKQRKIPVKFVPAEKINADSAISFPVDI